jgi:hypothetical protein
LQVGSVTHGFAPKGDAPESSVTSAGVDEVAAVDCDVAVVAPAVDGAVLAVVPAAAASDATSANTALKLGAVVASVALVVLVVLVVAVALEAGVVAGVAGAATLTGTCELCPTIAIEKSEGAMRNPFGLL